MHLQQAIVTLRQQGWSKRRIARELGVDRGTIGKCLRDSQPAISLTGSEGGSSSKPAIVHTGSAVGRPSLCEPWREQIDQAVQAGLSAQRIYQDLVTEQQFAGSYHSVQRFARSLRAALPLPFRRLEVEPGQEVQVDFGQGGLGDRRGPTPPAALVSLGARSLAQGHSEAV